MNNAASNLRNPTRAWLPAALLALTLGGAAVAVPGQARAADVQVRVLVDVADLIFRSGRPYYYDDGYYQPVVVEYDAWRRPVYYRYAPRPVVMYPPAPHRHAPPPRHYPPPHYRVGYGDHRDDWHGHDRGHDRDHGHGHGHGKPRGRWDD